MAMEEEGKELVEEVVVEKEVEKEAVMGNQSAVAV